MINFPRHSHRKGFTLLETLLTLIALMVITGMAAIMWSQQRNVQTARTLAYRQAELLTAAQNYLASNSATLIVDVVGGPVAIPAGRLTVGGGQPVGSAGLVSMQTGGFINSQFVDTNQYLQNSWLVVRAGATANSLEGIVFTSGGSAIPDNVLGTAMQFIGADGGYIPNTPIAGQVGLIIGSKGGWVANDVDFTVPGFAAPTAGHLAAWIALTPNSGIAGDFLWRTNIGIPEANRMHTNIDVGQHELDHVRQITGGPDPLNPDPGNSAQTAINIANTIVPGIADTTGGVDASLQTLNAANVASYSAAKSEYVDPTTGLPYNNYIRANGNTRLNRIDPSVIIDNASWDINVDGVNPRSYPAGTRLIDALPPVVIMASYVGADGDVIPMPRCGNANNPVTPGPQRIFATPLSSFDYFAPQATTTNSLNFISVPVINTATLSGGGGSPITLNTTNEIINNVASVSATTVVEASGLGVKIYATPLAGISWTFHASRWSGAYVTAAGDPLFGSPLADPTNIGGIEAPNVPYATTYRTEYLIQTACYYGL